MNLVVERQAVVQSASGKMLFKKSIMDCCANTADPDQTAPMSSLIRTLECLLKLAYSSILFVYVVIYIYICLMHFGWHKIVREFVPY